MRLPRPSLPTTVAIVLWLYFASAMPLVDYDYFWHSKVGEWIVSHGWTRPTTEPFAFTTLHSRWVVQGWLFDVAQYLLHRHFGEFGVRATYGLLTIGTWALVYASARLFLGGDKSRALLVTAVCLAAAAPYITARPIAATNLAFAFVCFALLKFETTGAYRWLVSLPPVFAFWVNLHFGYVTGLGLIVLFALAAWLDRITPISGAPVQRAALGASAALLIVIASLIATGANPYGWGVVTETIGMTRTNMVTNVLDWLSPDFRKPTGLLFLLPIGVLFVTRALSGRAPVWLDIVLPLSLVGAALFSQRHIPLAAIALAPCIARALAGWRPATLSLRLPGALGTRFQAAAGRQLGDVEHRLNLALLGVAVIAAVLLHPLATAWQERRLSQFLPVQAADFVLEKDLRGPLFNDYHTGGYLMHRLYPREKIFVDGRYNPFTGATLQDYEAMTMLRKDWPELLDKYDIRLAILAAPSIGLPAMMAGAGRYRLVYADARFGVLIRSDVQRPDLPTVEAPPPGIAVR